MYTYAGVVNFTLRKSATGRYTTDIQFVQLVAESCANHELCRNGIYETIVSPIHDMLIIPEQESTSTQRALFCSDPREGIYFVRSRR